MGDIRIQFGHRLRECRLDKGLSQEELADRADMSVPYLSDLERGLWNPSLAMIVDLANGLGIDPGELVGGSGQARPANRAVNQSGSVPGAGDPCYATRRNTLPMAGARAPSRLMAKKRRSTFQPNDVVWHLRSKHPSMPQDQVNHIVAEVSGRVWEPPVSLGRAVGIVLTNGVRHTLTDYEAMLRHGLTRDEARLVTRDEVQDLIRSWRARPGENAGI